MRVLALAAVLAAAATAAAKPGDGQAAGVHGVDWRNFTYPSPVCNTCLGGGPIKLRNGRTEPDPIFTDVEAHLVGVSFFDATGDEQDEALVEVYWRFSDKGFTRRFYLYGMSGRLELVWQGYQLGYEEEVNGVVKVKPRKRGIVVEDLDGAGRTTLLTYAGGDDRRLRLVRKTRLGHRR